MSQYGGQAANAFTQGLQQGFNFVDNARNSQQNRELKAQQASQAAELHTKQLEALNTQNKLNTQAVDLNQVKLDAIEAVKAQVAGQKVPKLLVEWQEPNKQIQTADVKQFLKNNQKVASTLGIQNIDTITDTHPTDVLDKTTKLYEFWSKQYTPEMYRAETEQLGLYDANNNPDGITREELEQGYLGHLEHLAMTYTNQTKSIDGNIAYLPQLIPLLGGGKQLTTAAQDKLNRQLADLDDKARQTPDQYIHQIATEATPRKDGESDTDYNKRVNNEFIRLKRDINSGMGSQLPSQIRTTQWLLSKVNDPSIPAGIRKVYQNQLAKHTQTGTQINVEDKTTRGVNSLGGTTTNDYGYKGDISTSGVNDTSTSNDTNDVVTVKDQPFSFDYPAKPLTQQQKVEETNAWQVMTDKKQLPTFNKEVVAYNQEAQSVKSAVKLSQALDKLVSKGDYKTGMFDNLLQTLDELTPGDKTNSNTIEQAVMNAGLGREVASYLKEMSGASATNEEFIRTLKNTLGSSWTQEGVQAEVFKSFVNDRVDKFKEKTKHLINTKMYSTAKAGLEAAGLANDTKPKSEPVGGVDSPLDVDASIEGW